MRSHRTGTTAMTSRSSRCDNATCFKELTATVAEDLAFLQPPDCLGISGYQRGPTVGNRNGNVAQLTHPCRATTSAAERSDQHA
jgi:hypothetical protein